MDKLDQKGKNILAVKLVEKASSYLQENVAKKLIYEAIKVACQFIHKEECVGEALYIFLIMKKMVLHYSKKLRKMKNILVRGIVL